MQTGQINAPARGGAPHLFARFSGRRQTSEAMELVERFFEIGAKASPRPVAIFLAGCRECLPEWEIQVAGWPRARADHDCDAEGSDAEFCPRGQSGRGSEC